MQIKDMFEKDIERDIKGVIKVDQKSEDLIYQELDEYVVTNELSKHFTEFFANYNKGISSPTDDIGVWISGFFGSGKSHFLKILSYILDSDLEVQGRKPINFFRDDGKIKDSIVIGNMESATNVDTDVILFNIDSKSAQSDKKDILNVFIKVFNEMRGYCGGIPFLADLEKKLDDVNLFDKFKEEFKNIADEQWEESRDDFFYIQDEIIEVLVKIDFMSEEAARNWAEKAEDNMDITIENFAQEINEYCSKKGNNHHIVFLVDEVGQFIADDTQLMLNLQTIVEELGIRCHGKAWVIVTSQQNIDDITKDIKGIDFSKIQGRFKTKLSLSSSNVDEVIRRRILAKNKQGQQFLEAQYPSIEASLKNILTFDGKVEMKTYENAEDFANIYPFVPYQFNRVQDVLTSIREHSASGKHMADGERSMLALFQESAISMKDETDGALVPFNIFYNAIEAFIDHTHKIVINKSYENNRLTNFDVEVLKVLFMIKYVKEIKATSKNLTTLMISNVNEDRLQLNKKIDKSLKRLLEQTKIQKNGDVYSFLTNEEQDINKEIKNEIVDTGEFIDEAASRIFNEIYATKKYKVSNRYNFSFNQAIDERERTSRYDIGMRLITPYYESETPTDLGQTQLDTAGNNIIHVLKGVSETNNEVIVQLPNDLTVFDEIKETLQISKYLTKKSTELKPDLRARKQEEYNDKNARIEIFLEEAIKNATIFVKGDKVDIPEKNASDRLDDAMGKLVNKVYNKLSYMDFEPNSEDILKVLKEEVQVTFGNVDTTCLNALNDLEDYVSRQFSMHNSPSLKSILNRFSSAPYGFTNLDIQWLVAKLFSQKKIALTLNSLEISLRNEGAEKIRDYLTKSEYFEKLLISKKKVIGEIPIASLKRILKEVYNENVSISDAERLMELFKKYNSEKLAEINECLGEFRIFDKYPGRKILESASELFNEIDSKKNTSAFYDYVPSCEEDILDKFEYLEPVLAFFKGSQKGIFKESYGVYDNYVSNKNLLQDGDLDDIAEAIKRILDMPSPYSNIQHLPQFNKEFNDKLDLILEEKRQIVRNDISKDCSIVLSKLTDDKLKELFEKQVNSSFEGLVNKLNSEKNIAIINGVTDESDNLRVDYLNKINGLIGPKPVSEINISIKNDIIGTSKFRIQSEEDLNVFLEQISNQVKIELNNDKIVNLKFN